jgi:hypothetical protein
MEDKYVIVVDGVDVEIDKDSPLGKCKEFVDKQNTELWLLIDQICESYGVQMSDLE